MTNKKLTIAVDFDHTLVDHDKPFPGAKEAMQKLWGDGHYLLIYSCNNRDWIEKILNKYDIPFHEIYGKEGGKPNCDFYIDDRSIPFRNDWTATIQDLYEQAEKRGFAIKRD